ncbi:MAG: ABC transporter permease [Nocardioidaceae bacterium]
MSTQREAVRTPRNLVWARRMRTAGRLWRDFRNHRAGLLGLGMLGVVCVLALMAPLFISDVETSLSKAPGPFAAPPSWEYPLGTDNVGRSVLHLVWQGARVSLTIGFLATLLSVFLGTLVGILAGHFRGWVESVLMRFTDWVLVLPTLVLAVALVVVMGRGSGTIILAIGVTAWPVTARLVRAQTLAVEARPFIERAKALGGGHWHVMSRHVLPNVMPIVLARTTLLVAGTIIAESTLAFLGLGDPSNISWGSILQQARDAGATSAGLWWWIVPPGIAIAAVALAFTMCGRALEHVLNPHLREHR